MVNRDELLDELQNWVKTNDGRSLIIQFVKQHGKYNVNLAEGSEISVGDTLHKLETDLLAEIRDLLRSQLPSPPLEINWQEVSRRLLEEKLQVTTNPMTNSEDIAYQVEQVFVPLGLVQRKKVPRQKQDVPPEQGSELYQEGKDKKPSPKDSEQVEEVEVTQQFEHEEFLDQVLKQRQSPKSQGKRIAIIGEPGAGKTTILQQIARWVSTQFPESIVIWISLADLHSDALETYLEKRWLQQVIRQAGEAEASATDKKHFAAQFKQGQVWLFLDGVDEMPFVGNPLSEIQRQIQEGGWLQQARLILTCRLNLWDGNRNSLTSFDTYRSLDFSYPKQVEEFIEKWFAPRGKGDLGQLLCAALKGTGRERIRDLVKNPLRLTLLCFSWYLKQGQLPQTQAELYQRFVNRIYEWKQEQFPTTHMQRECLNQALAELSREAIDDADDYQKTRFRLHHNFIHYYLNIPIPEGQETLLDLVLRIGWLNQVGVDADDPEQKVYAFYHPTFQEYFAALSIDDGQFFLNHIPKNPMAKEASYRIFEPQWRQVFLLWLGRNNKALKPKKEALIQNLITFKDRCGGFYSDRAFLLAAVGISEFKDCSFSDEIVNQLMHWKFGSSNLLKRGWDIFFNPGRVNTRQNRTEMILNSTDSQKMIQALIKVLESTYSSLHYRQAIRTPIRALMWNFALTPELDHSSSLIGNLAMWVFIQDTNTSWSAADSLGKIDPGNKIAIRALKRLLETTQDVNRLGITNIQERAIKSLEKIASNNESAVETLAWLLTTTQNAFICQKAAESLGEINAKNDTAIQALVWVLKIIQDKSILKTTNWDAVDDDPLSKRHYTYTNVLRISFSAAKSLGKIGVGSKTAIYALVELLETTQDETKDTLLKVANPTFLQAVASLGEIGSGDETAIRALVQLLETTQDEKTCSLAAECLEKISIGNETAVRALVKIIQTTQNETVLLSAVDTLGTIGIGNDFAKQALVRLLEASSDEFTYIAAAHNLGRINPGNEITIRALKHLLATTQYLHVYRLAAYSLGITNPGNEKAIQALVWVLENTQDEANYLSVATDLCTIDSNNEIAKQILVQLLENTQDEAISLSAAEKLSMLDPSNKTAIPALLKILKTTQFSEKSYKTASDILGKIANGDKTAIQELLWMLDTAGSWGNFSRTLSNLSAIGVGNEIAFHALLQMLETSRDSTIQQMVEKNLSKIDVTGEMTTLALVQSLRRRTLAIKELHQLMMRCADTKPYREFRQAFKSYPWTYWIYRNLELIREVIKRSPFEFYFRIFWKY